MINVARFIRIGIAVYGYALWWIMVRLRLWRSRDTPAQRFAAMLDRLGTAFIKLGQGLSLHTELLPPDYIAALASLQDRVAPFPGEQAVREIERSFGRDLHDLFAEFDPKPLAAASVAQVHAARLHDGHAVIVKVRRPGIKSQVEQDTRILAFLLRTVLVFAPGLRRFDPLGLVEEIRNNLRKEMDFRHEARSIRRFGEIFRDSTTVFVPPAIEGMQTEWVGVQHMSSGLRIDDPQLGDAGPKLARAFVDAYLKQFFVVGMFHGDPHPGNLFVMDDGRICFHDFGLVGFLDRDTRRNLGAFMQAFVLQDADWLLDAAQDLGFLAPGIDRRRVGGALEELLEDYAQLPLREWSFAEALLRIARMGTGQHVRAPRNLLVLVRTIFLMESSVRILDSDFNLVDGLLNPGRAAVQAAIAAPAANSGEQRLQFETAVAMHALPGAVSGLVHQVRTGQLAKQLGSPGLDSLSANIERASTRLALSLVALGLYVAASLLMQHSIGPQVLGVPVLAVLGYAAAAWLTLRVIRVRP